MSRSGCWATHGSPATRLVGMSTLSRADVARLAALARIDMNDEDLDRLSGQLAAIVDAVALVSEVANEDVPATSHPIPMSNVHRVDEVRPSLSQADASGRRARGRGRALPRATNPWGGSMTDWTDPTQATRASALDMADALRAGNVTSVALVQAHLDRIAAVDGLDTATPCTRSCTSTPRTLSRPPPQWTPTAPPEWTCRCWPVCPSRSRTSWSPRACPPRRDPRFSRAGCRRTTPR